MFQRLSFLSSDNENVIKNNLDLVDDNLPLLKDLNADKAYFFDLV